MVVDGLFHTIVGSRCELFVFGKGESCNKAAKSQKNNYIKIAIDSTGIKVKKQGSVGQRQMEY